MRQVETVIVGGGPAGAVTACNLASMGREVVLVERAGAPHHKVCGEFLSIETQAQLQRLGVEPAALGAVPIDHVAVYASARSVTADLPFRALSLSRYRLDEALLCRAQERGAKLKRNVSVRAVTPDGGGWNVECDDDKTLRCRHLVLATGKLGLRGIGDARDNTLVGLKMHLRSTAEIRRALTGRVELFLLDRGYVGLELVEDGIVNLCCVLPSATVAQLAPGWSVTRDYLAAKRPSLAERLEGAEPLWDKAVAVVCPTGGYLHGEAGPAVYRVGDRLAHIPPFTGDGIAIALGSGALAAEHIKQDSSPAAYLAAARRLTGRTIRLASTISNLAASGIGQNVLVGAATCMPWLLRTIARRTRLPPVKMSVRH
jgi:flavin-dependent dehydrogenase